MSTLKEKEEEAREIIIQTMRNLNDFVHVVTAVPEHATPESIAALPDVAMAICRLSDRL